MASVVEGPMMNLSAKKNCSVNFGQEFVRPIPERRISPPTSLTRLVISEAEANTSAVSATDETAANPSTESAAVNQTDETDDNGDIGRRRSSSVLEAKEHAYTRLREELIKAQQELKLKDDQCKKLARIQDQMGEEIEELSASLFQEANTMVQEANVKRMNAEKLLKEANMKIDALNAEVTALKALVITSTPSMPNTHLHPQIDKTKKTEFTKGHRRSTSHHNFFKEVRVKELNRSHSHVATTEKREIDPQDFETFLAWRRCPVFDPRAPFLDRIFSEDVIPCLKFNSKQLIQPVYENILRNSLSIEPITNGSVDHHQCSLTGALINCSYCIKLGSSENTPTSYCISNAARNRIIAVCDFTNYIRYITQGIVKSEDKQMFWDILQLRKQICMARLGLMN